MRVITGSERTGSEVITGSDLILHGYNEFCLPQFEYFMSYLTQNISRTCYEGKCVSTRAPGPKIHLSKSTLAIRTTVLPIRILIRTTVVPIRILIRTTVVPIRILIRTTGITNTLLYPRLLCRGVYSFRLSVRPFVRSFVRTSFPRVEFASKFCVKVSQVVYISATTYQKAFIFGP